MINEPTETPCQSSCKANFSSVDFLSAFKLINHYALTVRATSHSCGLFTVTNCIYIYEWKPTGWVLGLSLVFMVSNFTSCAVVD